MRSVWKQVRMSALLAAAVVLLLPGCSDAVPSQGTDEKKAPEVAVKPAAGSVSQEQPNEKKEEPLMTAPTPSNEKNPPRNEAQSRPAQLEEMNLALEVVAEPASLAVLVNKQRKLPENYQPGDLVFPQVPFLLPENSDRRKMRAEAAQALEQMFAAAKADGVELAGVSAYRPHEYQKALFAR